MFQRSGGAVGGLRGNELTFPSMALLLLLTFLLYLIMYPGLQDLYISYVMWPFSCPEPDV